MGHSGGPTADGPPQTAIPRRIRGGAHTSIPTLPCPASPGGKAVAAPQRTVVAFCGLSVTATVPFLRDVQNDKDCEFM